MSDNPRIAIIGAGPVGFEAALLCASRKVNFVWLERGNPGQHLLMWGHLATHGPFGSLVSKAGMEALQSANLTEWLPSMDSPATGKSWVDGYLFPLSETPALSGKLRTGVDVIGAARNDVLREDDDRSGNFVLHLRESSGESAIEVPAVIDCTGVHAQPRPMGRGGISAPGEAACRDRICYIIEDILGADRSKYAGKSIVVVGAGVSAATAVLLLAELAREEQATWVTWLFRRDEAMPVKRRLRDPLAGRDAIAAAANHIAARGTGNIECHGGSWVESIRPGQNNQGLLVSAVRGGESRVFEADRVVSLCGYQPSRQFTRELRLPMDPVLDLPPTGLPAEAGISPGPPAIEPRWYTIGSKSYGRATDFSVTTGYKQAALVLAREFDSRPKGWLRAS